MSTDQAVWPRLVLATANPHKLIELTRILAADHVDVDLAEIIGLVLSRDNSCSSLFVVSAP